MGYIVGKIADHVKPLLLGGNIEWHAQRRRGDLTGLRCDVTIGDAADI